MATWTTPKDLENSYHHMNTEERQTKREPKQLQTNIPNKLHLQSHRKNDKRKTLLVAGKDKNYQSQPSWIQTRKTNH